MSLRIPPFAEWQRRFTALADWVVPAGDTYVGLWRRRMLGIALVLFAALALLTYSAGLIVALVRGDWKLIVIQTTLYAVLLLLVFARSWPFRLRAGMLTVLPAVLGTSLLITYGFVTMGFAWWIATPIMAMALFGFRTAIGALVSQAVTFFLIGWQLVAGSLDWAIGKPGITPFQYTVGPSGLLPFWFSSATSSVVLAAFLSLSIGYLFQGLVDESRARRAAENEVDKQQRLAALGTVASGIAHDFNNVLQPIVSDLETVQRAVADRPELQSLVPQMLANADRARALVRRTLRFGQPHDDAREVLELRDVLTEAVRMIRATVPSEIQVQLAPVPAARVHADAAEVQQLLLELVSNATQALPDGGVVQITATRQPIANELAATRLASADEAISIVVHDNGIGMSDEVQARAFDPFFTTRQDSGAAGLGLSTVHAIVSELGGVVRLKSQPGMGTCVDVMLPLTDAPLPQMGMRESSAPVAVDDLTGPVLVIDDEPAVLQATGRMLERLGYPATRISDPTQVMQDIRRMPQPPALVITDVAMPGLSGWELAEQLHADLPSVPIIVMSGHVDVLQQDLTRHPGVQALLAKPFTSAELGSVVSQVLRAAGACQPIDRKASPAAAP